MQDRLREAPGADAEQPVGRSRWTLQSISEQIEPLKGYSLGGISLWLRRHGLRWRGGREPQWSPDRAYGDKEAHLLACLRTVGSDPDHFVALFLDEVSYTAWPDLAFMWTECAPTPLPKADRRQSPYRRMRVIGALDARTGRVLTMQQSHFSAGSVAAFVRQIAAAYPPEQEVFLIWDNWPVHRSSAVQEALQQFPHIHVVALPTYAPWLNPIEKLWRMMRQDLTAMHRLADDWKQMQAHTHTFFDQFAHGSPRLLRYVGLTGSGKLATALQADP